MITPDELAAGIVPPPTTTPGITARALRLADPALALAEQLMEVVPAGRARDAAALHLVRTVQAAYAAMQPTLHPVAPDTTAEVGEVDTGLWRLGIQHTNLHPLARLVGWVLADCADPSGRIPDDQQPTLHQLATRTGLPLNTLHVCLGDLTTAGWITRHRITHPDVHLTHYRLSLPAPASRKD